MNRFDKIAGLLLIVGFVVAFSCLNGCSDLKTSKKYTYPTNERLDTVVADGTALEVKGTTDVMGRIDTVEGNLTSNLNNFVLAFKTFVEEKYPEAVAAIEAANTAIAEAETQRIASQAESEALMTEITEDAKNYATEQDKLLLKIGEMEEAILVAIQTGDWNSLIDTITSPGGIATGGGLAGLAGLVTAFRARSRQKKADKEPSRLQPVMDNFFSALVEGKTPQEAAEAAKKTPPVA